MQNAMARTLFSIAPSVLKWARERAGFSIAELSANFRDYADWEAGKGGPSYPQLEALGDKLKIPVAVFFFPEPPETAPIEETFRTLPDTVLHELPPKVRLLLRKAKSFQLNVSELLRQQEPVGTPHHARPFAAGQKLRGGHGGRGAEIPSRTDRDATGAGPPTMRR